MCALLMSEYVGGCAERVDWLSAKKCCEMSVCAGSL